MKLLTSEFGLNVSNKGFLYNAEKIPDRDPTFESQGQLKKLASAVLNCNKLDTNKNLKNRDERRILKDLREIKLDDSNVFSSLMNKFDQNERVVQNTLATHAEKIQTDLQKFTNQSAEHQESKESFDLIREENGTRSERKATRLDRRSDRKEAKRAQKKLTKSVSNFKEQFEKSFKKFKQQFDQAKQIKEFSDEQFSLRKELLESRTEKLSLLTNVGNKDLKNRMQISVDESQTLFNTAEQAQINANRLFNEANRIFKNYQSIHNSVETINNWKEENDLLLIGEKKSEIFAATKDIANRLNHQENEKSMAIKNADQNKDQIKFSTKQKDYDLAKKELSEAQDAEYPEQETAKKRLKDAQTTINKIEHEFKNNFNDFSINAIKKLNSLNKNKASSATALTNKAKALTPQIETIINNLKNSINNSKQNGVVSDAISQQKLLQAQRLLSILKSNNSSIISNQNEINTLSSEIGINTGNTELLKTAINSHQSNLDSVKTHINAINQEAQEYLDLGITGINKTPFTNTEITKSIAEQKEKLTRIKKIQEFLDTYNSETDRTKKDTITKNFIVSALFKSEIKKYFKKSLEKNKQGTSFENTWILMFKDIDSNLKKQLKKILDDTLGSNAIDKRIKQVIKKTHTKVSDNSFKNTTSINHNNSRILSNNSLNISFGGSNNEDSSAISSPSNSKKQETLSESQSTEYLNAAKDTPEFKWVMRQLVGKDLDLNTNDWNDIRKIKIEDLKQFREGTLDKAQLLLLAKIGFSDKEDVTTWLNGTEGQLLLKSKHTNLSDFFVSEVKKAKKGTGMATRANDLLLNNGERLMNPVHVNKIGGENSIQKLYNLESAGLLSQGFLYTKNIEDAVIDPIFRTLLKTDATDTMSLAQMKIIKTAIDTNLIETIANVSGSKDFQIQKGNKGIKGKQFSSFKSLTEALSALDPNATVAPVLKISKDLYQKVDLTSPKARNILANIFKTNTENSDWTTSFMDSEDWDDVRKIPKEKLKLLADNTVTWDGITENFKLAGNIGPVDLQNFRNFLQGSLGDKFFASKADNLGDFFAIILLAPDMPAKRDLLADLKAKHDTITTKITNTATSIENLSADIKKLEEEIPVFELALLNAARPITPAEKLALTEKETLLETKKTELKTAQKTLNDNQSKLLVNQANTTKTKNEYYPIAEKIFKENEYQNKEILSTKNGLQSHEIDRLPFLQDKHNTTAIDKQNNKSYEYLRKVQVLRKYDLINSNNTIDETFLGFLKLNIGHWGNNETKLTENDLRAFVSAKKHDYFDSAFDTFHNDSDGLSGDDTDEFEVNGSGDSWYNSDREFPTSEDRAAGISGVRSFLKWIGGDSRDPKREANTAKINQNNNQTASKKTF